MLLYQRDWHLHTFPRNTTSRFQKDKYSSFMIQERILVTRIPYHAILKQCICNAANALRWSCTRTMRTVLILH